MSDLISRQTAIDAIQQHCKNVLNSYEYDKSVAFIYEAAHNHIIEVIERLPSAQPEVKAISYQDCQNALLKMWMDNVVTDGEYRRIVDKLNAIQEEQDGIHQQKESD